MEDHRASGRCLLPHHHTVSPQTALCIGYLLSQAAFQRLGAIPARPFLPTLGAAAAAFRFLVAPPSAFFFAFSLSAFSSIHSLIFAPCSQPRDPFPPQLPLLFAL